MAVLNLTESRIRDMEFGSGIWRDAQVKGLLVICHAATKTYAVQGDVRRHGRHESREVRRPAMDRKWSPVIAERVIEVVARTGSPKVASKATGVSVATIHDHRKRDPDFGARYAEAMECAFNVVLGHAFERSLDLEAPSDRLTEVLLKFRFVDRAPAFDPTAPDRPNADGPLGLDARVIARMAPQDRAALAAALGTYIRCETELHADDALVVLP